MTAHHTTTRNTPNGRSKLLLMTGVVALLLAILAGFAVASSIGAAEAAAPQHDAPEESTAQLPSAPLKIGIDEPSDDLDIRPQPDKCPPGMIYHDGQCLEFIPPSDDCPQGTIEHNGECLEFEVPDCDPGYILDGLDCVPLTIDPPAEPGDDCPPAMIYHDGQCLEFEVPECDLGYVLVGLECVKITFEATPIEPTPEAPVEPAVPVVPPVVETPETPEDDCPEGTYLYQGECIEFPAPLPEPIVPVVPPVLDLPVDPECDLGFVFFGGECIELNLEATPYDPTPAEPAVPVVPVVPPVVDNGGADCPDGMLFHNGECIPYESPICDLGYVAVGHECVKIVLEATPIMPDPVPAVPVVPSVFDL